MERKFGEPLKDVAWRDLSNEEVFVSPFDGHLYVATLRDLGLEAIYEIVGTVFPDNSVPQYKMIRYDASTGHIMDTFMRYTWLDSMFAKVGLIRDFDHGI